MDDLDVRSTRQGGLAAVLAFVIAGASAAVASCGDDATDTAALDGGSDGLLGSDAPAPTVDSGADVATDAALDASIPQLVIHSSTQWVFLGDGSKYKAAADGGVVVFADPALTLPQTITGVTVVPGLDGGQQTIVTSLVDVGVREVWLSASEDYVAQINIQGRVVQADAGVAANIAGPSGYVTSSSEGAFSLAVLRLPSTSSPIALCARGTGDAGMLGAFLGVALPEAGPPVLLPTDIVLDHAFDASIAVNALGSVTDVQIVDYAPGKGRVCSFEAPLAGTGGGPPYTAAAPSQTPPFDSFTRYAYVRRNHFSPLGATRSFWPVAKGATSVDVPIPTLPTITAPPISDDEGAPAIVPAGPLSVAWTGIDPSSHYVAVVVNGVGGGPLAWVVYLPPSRTSFAFFELPAGLAPIRWFPSNKPHYVNVYGRTILAPSAPTGPLFSSAAVLYDEPNQVPIQQALRLGFFRME